jgi:uncharacterized caspase-like protein
MLFGATLILTLAGSAGSFAADRVALVIGNGAYQRVPVLANPPRDAADIAGAFERLNFKVTHLSNASASEMRKAIVAFGRASEGSDMAVIFYAGHGMEMGGENWLIPVDAELRSDTDVESEAISLKSLNLQVSKARQLGLVILDACRNNPFAAQMKGGSRTRAVARGLAPTEPTDNVLVAYAARDGTTANDGDGRNSPFTASLLRNIEKPGLEISFLFRNVRDEVMSATKREQQPFVYGSLSKEAIYLKAPEAASASATPLLPPSNAKSAALRQDPGQQQSTPPADSKKNLYTAEDAQRVTAFANELNLKMPPFAIGETKADVSPAAARFVGIWSSKIGFGDGKGRRVMLIVTEVSSVPSDLALGFYLWGPPTKLSWEQNDPAGYVSFAGTITDGVLRFKSGTVPIEAKLSAANKMSLEAKNPKKPSEIVTAKLDSLWQLSSTSKPTMSKR